MSLRASTGNENGGYFSTGRINLIRHSRAGGNPGSATVELTWMPAFAGMTKTGTDSVCRSAKGESFLRIHEGHEGRREFYRLALRALCAFLVNGLMDYGVSFPHIQEFADAP